MNYEKTFLKLEVDDRSFDVYVDGIVRSGYPQHPIDKDL
jgi:hypothetical protein